MQEAAFGAGHVEVVIALVNLANADVALGDLVKRRGRDLLERALRIQEAALGVEHVGVRCARFMCLACCGLPRHLALVPEAEPLCEQRMSCCAPSLRHVSIKKKIKQKWATHATFPTCIVDAGVSQQHEEQPKTGLNWTGLPRSHLGYPAGESAWEVPPPSDPQPVDLSLKLPWWSLDRNVYPVTTSV